jgi:hypothetical protein
MAMVIDSFFFMIHTHVDNNKQTNKILGTQTFKFGSVVSFAGDWVVRKK